jgi:hypothetical protein
MMSHSTNLNGCICFARRGRIASKLVIASDDACVVPCCVSEKIPLVQGLVPFDWPDPEHEENSSNMAAVSVSMVVCFPTQVYDTS